MTLDTTKKIYRVILLQMRRVMITMIRSIAKYGLLLLTSICLVIACYFTYHYSADKDSYVDKIKVDVEVGGATENIKLWESDDGIYYCFLPTYADLTQSYFKFDTNEQVSLNENVIENGDSLSSINFENDYTLKIGNEEHILKFMQSANTASIYIDTISGGIKKISSDKTYKEKMNITIFTESGG